MSPNDAITQLVETWLAEARVVEKYDPAAARIVERLATEAREVVDASSSPWVSLAELRERTGYSPDTLRAKAQELRSSGLSRKIGGSWHIERGAATAFRPKRRSQPIHAAEMRDIGSLARRLASED